MSPTCDLGAASRLCVQHPCNNGLVPERVIGEWGRRRSQGVLAIVCEEPDDTRGYPSPPPVRAVSETPAGRNRDRNAGSDGITVSWARLSRCSVACGAAVA